MKRKLLVILCALALALAGITPASSQTEGGGGAMIADVVIARPLGFVATVLGTTFFVVSLPFSAASGNVGKAADALVKRPAKATFTRPLGDFESLRD